MSHRKQPRPWTCANPECNNGGIQTTAGRPKKWCSDACRKRTLYSGVCVDCGGRTDGVASGRERAATRCASCAMRYQHKNRLWTREAIICAIQHWADEHGGIPPASQEWNVGYMAKRGQDAQLRKFYDGGYPHTTTVLYEFGRWNTAIAAAGFVPRQPSERRFGAAAA